MQDQYQGRNRSGIRTKVRGRIRSKMRTSIMCRNRSKIRISIRAITGAGSGLVPLQNQV